MLRHQPRPGLLLVVLAIQRVLIQSQKIFRGKIPLKDLVLADHKDAAGSDGLERVVPGEGAALDLDAVHVEFVRVAEVVEGDADVAPPVERRHLAVPAAVLRAALAGSAHHIYLHIVCLKS